MKTISVIPDRISSLRKLAIKAKTNHGYQLSQDMLKEIEAIEQAKEESAISFFCWHKWSKWGEVVPAYSHNSQHKTCLKCNAIKWRKVGSSAESGGATLINNQIENINKD